METLFFRFPAAQGIYRFQVKGNDLAPFLDQVKSSSERIQKYLIAIFATGTRLVWRVVSSVGAVSSALDKLLDVVK
jgi:hypothetical protein